MNREEELSRGEWKPIDDVAIDTKCPYCKKTTRLFVREENFIKWRKGALVQKAFPEMSADNREMLITGICPTCWIAMFEREEEK